MEGTGSITYPDGSVYIGAMKGDQPNGQGAITYPDGSTYQGNWDGGHDRGPGPRHLSRTVGSTKARSRAPSPRAAAR